MEGVDWHGAAGLAFFVSQALLSTFFFLFPSPMILGFEFFFIKKVDSGFMPDYNLGAFFMDCIDF